MSYTIYYAMSCRNCDLIIDLAKSGDHYTVVIWNKHWHRSERRYETKDYEKAKGLFDKWCEDYGMTKIEKVEQTWDARDFD